MNPIKIVLRDATGAFQTVHFSSEDSLVQALKDTYNTHAPVEFTYVDGGPVGRDFLNRIHERLFSN